MGGYVEKLLGKNEKIIIAARQHWTTLAITFIVNLFVAIVLIGLAIFLGNQSFTQDRSSILHLVPTVLLILLIVPVARFGWDWLQWWAEEYLVTSHRVIQTEGIINKKTKDSSLEKVNDIVLTQSFFGRILGYGNLEIITGSDEGVNLLRRLANPVTFKTALLDQKEARGYDQTGEQVRPMSSGGPAAADDDPLKRIADLDNLHKSGALSDAEYQTAKVKLLSKL
jgi:uncharacterized membrane protein YdbT with pleckstrin-like domain